MKSVKEFLELVEKKNKSGDSGLGDWIRKSSGTDPKTGRKVPGWVQIGGTFAGAPCARQEGQKSTPKCGSSKMAANLSDEEEERAFRRKNRKDPNQPEKSGAAKPTYVKTEEMNLQEKKKESNKDACYHKVKSRYDVWPSAYGSLALSKCRKVGASNWGNKSEELDLFDLVYDFLISEDLDEQDVLDIMARVPIEEILEVIEEDADWKKRNFRPLPDDSIENVANKARKIMSDIRTQRARPLSRFRPGVRRQVKKKATQFLNINHALKMKQKDLNARMKEFDINENTIKRFQREEFILEYLLSYGYADSYDAAVEIYESMSDEWLYDILEEF